MARRRRKPSRTERAKLSARAETDGEALASGPDLDFVFESDAEEVGGDVYAGDALMNGAPRRELVFFELVEDEPAAPAEAGRAGPPAGEPEASPPDRPAPPPPLPGLFEEPENPETVLERLEAARLQNPDDLEVLLGLVATLGLLGRFEEAARELRRAQRVAPEDVAVRAGAGLLSFRRGLYQQAEAELRWVCEHDPEHGPAHFYRGEALNRLGRVDQALEVLGRATELQPTNYRAFHTLGMLYDRKNLRDQAALMYRKARELQRR
jgi:tetratricopeptide (TPR) repeat protein